MLTGLLMEVPQLRHFFTELGFYYGSAVGPCGLLASIASTNPRNAWAYLREAENGDRQALAMHFAELAQMMAALRRAVGEGPFVDGAYDKVLAKVLEPDFPLALLPPQVCGAADAWEKYRDFLETRFPNLGAGSHRDLNGGASHLGEANGGSHLPPCRAPAGSRLVCPFAHCG